MEAGAFLFVFGTNTGSGLLQCGGVASKFAPGPREAGRDIRHASRL